MENEEFKNDKEVIDAEFEVEAQDEIVKPAKTVEPKKSVGETISDFKENVKVKIKNMEDRKAKIFGYIGAVVGIVIIISLLFNYISLTQMASMRFGRTLLFMLPQILLVIAGASICYFNKLFKENKYIQIGFWINVVAFFSIFLTLLWAIIIF